MQKGVREHFRLKRLAAWGPPPEKFSDPFLVGCCRGEGAYKMSGTISESGSRVALIA